MSKHTSRKTHPPDWDALVTQYCNASFIENDPISFAHHYRNTSTWQDCEMVAFLSAMFSYGRRELILKALHQILTPLGSAPVTTLLEQRKKDRQKSFKNFYYRFQTAHDLLAVLDRLQEIYQTQGSLKQLWTSIQDPNQSLQHQIHHFRQAFFYGGKTALPETYGLKFLFADPLQNSAAKRFNMFLRWVVRADAVDLGLWAESLTPASLIFPLDTHVAAMARQYQITQRQSNDWKTASEITAYFRPLSPEDPVRYDFALFGLGLERQKK